jgi:CBS domain-containing protein
MQSRTDIRAAQIMTSEMITTSSNAPIAEAAALLVDHGISGMPVRDEFGRIVGLISLRDIVRFERERTLTVEEDADRTEDWGAEGSVGRWQMSKVPWGYHLEPAEVAQVRDFMTPIVISLPKEATVQDVARAMLDRKVHRVLVHNGEGEVVGIISALDVVRAMVEGSAP